MNILFGAIGALALLVGTGRAADDKAPARNVRITVFHSSQRLEKISGAGATKTRTTSETRQEILVMSGGRARIQVADQVPYADWFWTWGQGAGLWPAQSVQWRDVGTSLAVEPVILDDQTIRLRVTPEFSYFLDRERLVTRVQQLSTGGVAREGEEIDLGSLQMSNEFKERFLIGLSRGGETEQVRIRLKARVER